MRHWLSKHWRHLVHWLPIHWLCMKLILVVKKRKAWLIVAVDEAIVVLVQWIPLLDLFQLLQGEVFPVGLSDLLDWAWEVKTLSKRLLKDVIILFLTALNLRCLIHLSRMISQFRSFKVGRSNHICLLTRIIAGRPWGAYVQSDCSRHRLGLLLGRVLVGRFLNLLIANILYAVSVTRFFIIKGLRIGPFLRTFFLVDIINANLDHRFRLKHVGVC